MVYFMCDRKGVTMIHIVSKGESVYQISIQYNISVQEIIEKNGLIYPYTLVPGQALFLQVGDMRKTGSLYVNGYAYPFIQKTVLDSSIPALSSLTIFGYGFTTTGELIVPDDVALLQTAMNNNLMPVFLISSLTSDGTFSSENASYLFENEWLQDTLLRQILDTMLEKGYERLDIDFEFIKPEDKEGFIGFIQKAVDLLHPQGLTVHVDLAPKTSAEQAGLLYEAHDYRRIGEIADTVLLMTYEWGYTYGPPMAVAPLDKVRQVVEYAVTEIDVNKIYLGIPNYGYDWKLPFVRGTTKAETLGNEQAMQRAIQYGSEILYDEAAMSPYYYYTAADGATHVVWFENVVSIQAKLDLIREFGLRGAGYWNLMRPFTQNWRLVESEFVINKTENRQQNI